MLFDYESGVPEIYIREGGYLPGTIAKTGWKECESMNSASPNDRIEFGAAVKRNLGEVVPFVSYIDSEDTAQDFYGIAVKDVQSQSQVQFDLSNPKFIANYFSGTGISVMTGGYVVVPIQQGIPVVGQPVYMRIAPSVTNPSLPIGGLEALGDVGNVALKGVTFASDGFYPFNSTNSSTTENGVTGQCATIYIDKQPYGLEVTITQAPNDVTITYGTLPSSVTLTGGSASYGGEAVEGTFVMNNPYYLYPVGTYDTTCTFIPNDPQYEKVTNVEIGITVNKATPTIEVAPVTTENLYYGDALSELTLVGGSASVKGSFAWSEPNTRPQANGNQEVTFTPEDTDDYNVVTGINVMVNIVKVPLQIISKPTASSIASGSQLSTSVLSGGTVADFRDAEADVEGSWAWTNGATQVDATGSFEAKFTPTNADKYETITTMVEVTITGA